MDKQMERPSHILSCLLQLKICQNLFLLNKLDSEIHSYTETSKHQYCLLVTETGARWVVVIDK